MPLAPPSHPSHARRSLAGTRAPSAPVVRAVVACAVAFLAGCSDTAPNVTAPGAGGPQPSVSAVETGGPVRHLTAAGRPGDPLAVRLPNEPGACLVAIRGGDGTYYSRTVQVPLPQAAGTRGATTTRLGYRGWAMGVAEPVEMAICTIPDSRAARRYLEQRLEARPMNAKQLFRFAQQIGVADVDQWRYGQAPAAVPSSTAPYVIEGVARTPAYGPVPAGTGTAKVADGVAPMMMEETPCSPHAIIPEPGCEGWTPEPEPEPPTEPPPPVDPETGEPVTPGELSYSVEPPAGPAICAGGTGYVHLSGTAGFGRNINVHAYDKCPIQVQFNVQTWLTRWRCGGFLWFSCGYRTIATGMPVTFVAREHSTRSTATSNCTVRKGRYMGYSLHRTVNLSNGYTVVYRSASLRDSEITCSWL